MNLKVRIMNLVNRALRAKNAGMPKGFEIWMAEQKKLEAELAAIDEAAGKGLAVGRTLSYNVADGTATYVVTKIRKNDCIVEWVPLYDGYFSDAVWLTADKRHYIVQRTAAERQCQFADALNYHGR